MDFKSVVYNAARDGKLKRLKVSDALCSIGATALPTAAVMATRVSRFNRGFLHAICAIRRA